MAQNGKDTDSPFEAGGLFIFDADPIVEWPVRVKYPVAGGAVRDVEIPMELQYVSGDALQEVLVACSTVDPKAFGSDDDPLAGLVRGWRGIAKQGAARELACDDETKRLVLAKTNVRVAVIEALVQMANGAEAKNSATPAGVGPNRRARRAAKARTVN